MPVAPEAAVASIRLRLGAFVAWKATPALPGTTLSLGLGGLIGAWGPRRIVVTS